MISQHLTLLGKRCEDKVTHAIGIVTSVSFDLYGCVLALLQPTDRDEKGEMRESRWYDVKRLFPHTDERVMEVPNYDAIPVGLEPGPAEKPLPPSGPQ